MQIYVVKSGDTVSGIARQFNISASRLASVNQLPDPNRLVVGQAIVIPIVGEYYVVQRGDTLWQIGQKFNISYQRLASVNNIPVTRPLTVGTRLYIPPAPKREGEFYGYVDSSRRTITADVERQINDSARALSYIGPSSFEAKRDGSLSAPNLNNFRSIAENNRLIYSMVITNIEEGAFNEELGHILLTNTAVQNTLLNNIVTTAKANNFRDIHFDFEFLRAEDREAYNNFLRKARDRFKQEGWLISTALAPKTSATQQGQWYEAHDYKAHGEIVDFVVLMTYEWGYSGGPPLAVSPINQVQKVIEYAVTEIPASKILMGQNLYGYDWTLPYKQGNPPAKAYSAQRALEIAYQYNTSIQYSTTSQAPYYNYRDEQDKDHVVRFEDARSIQRKFDLVKQFELRGVAYWKLGLPFPQNWLLILKNFNVRKFDSQS